MKCRTNVSMDKSLFDSARKHNLVLSAIPEKALRRELQKIEEREWIKNNKAAAEEYEKFIMKNGIFSEGGRSF